MFVHWFELCRYVPHCWATGGPCSSSRDIPWGSHTTWSRSKLAVDDGLSTSSTKDELPSLHVCGCDVQQVESFVYLGAMIHSSCSNDPEICRRSAMTHSAMQSLDWHLWRSHITTETKLHLYRVFILLIMLYGCECLAVNKADLQQIDALDQWCLWRILGIRWPDFVRNADVYHMTNQPPVSSIVKSRRHQSHFWAPSWELEMSRGRPRPTWMKTIQGNLSSLDLELQLAQNRPLWRMISWYSTTHP